MPMPTKRPKHTKHRQKTAHSRTLLIYGRHAVAAAVSNSARPIIRLLATEQALKSFTPPADLRIEMHAAEALDRMVPDQTPHQGLILEAKALPPIDLQHWLDANAETKRLLALDQVTDPRNLGAILRSAAAFDVAAVILPERHSAELNGACARAAAGALDLVPIIQVTNLARSLAAVKEAGFWTVGLDGNAEAPLNSIDLSGRTCVVLGAEDTGLRQLTQSHCDHLAALPIHDRIESLNVAVAAGIALYCVSQAS